LVEEDEEEEEEEEAAYASVLSHTHMVILFHISVLMHSLSFFSLDSVLA